MQRSLVRAILGTNIDIYLTRGYEIPCNCEGASVSMYRCGQTDLCHADLRTETHSFHCLSSRSLNVPSDVTVNNILRKIVSYMGQMQSVEFNDYAIIVGSSSYGSTVTIRDVW